MASTPAPRLPVQYAIWSPAGENRGRWPPGAMSLASPPSTDTTYTPRSRWIFGLSLRGGTGSSKRIAFWTSGSLFPSKGGRSVRTS
ncbi:MAG: hypothetical protein HY721_26640 [Planctomycetes bacterium]|nr:hypothetical protein [Planctomycetota bacterium]